MAEDNIDEPQRKIIDSINRLNRSLHILSKNSLKENTAKSLNENMESLSSEMKKNFDVIKSYKTIESPILTAVRENLKSKKEGVKESLRGTNIFRKLFGIREGSGTLVDAIVRGFEERGEYKRAREDFRKDYAKFSREGQIDSETLSKSEFNKKSDALYDEIRAKEAELASANADVLKGLESEFGRATDADLDRQALLEHELALLKSAGFGETDAEKDELYKQKTAEYEESTLKEQENAENKKEQSAALKEQTSLLEAIAENTGGKGSGGEDPNDSKSKKGKGIIGSILGALFGAGVGIIGSIKNMGAKLFGGLFLTLKTGLFKALKILFNPRVLMKAITKVFVPAMIVGSLVNGIMDGFEAWKETGSIKEALISGLGGILDFLTFGLFDKETIETGLEAAKSFANDYIVTPFNNLVQWVGDTFTAYIIEPIKNIIKKVVEWKDNLLDVGKNLYEKGVKVAKNLVDDGIEAGGKVVRTFTGTSAETVVKKASEESTKNILTPNKSSALELVKPTPPILGSEVILGKTMENNKTKVPTQSNSVVNAPTNISNQVSNNHIKAPVKNPDNSFMNYSRVNAAY